MDALDHTVSDVIEAALLLRHHSSHDEGMDHISSNISLSEYEPRMADVFMRKKIPANGIESIKK